MDAGRNQQKLGAGAVAERKDTVEVFITFAFCLWGETIDLERVRGFRESTRGEGVGGGRTFTSVNPTNSDRPYCKQKYVVFVATKVGRKKKKENLRRGPGHTWKDENLSMMERP